MDSRKMVLKNTGVLAVGVLLCSAVMVGIFAALGYFGMDVLWGALIGTLVIITNHFFLAVTVELAADRAECGEINQAQTMVRMSSLVRLIVMGVVLLIGVKLGCNVLALVLPLIFQRPVLMLVEFFGRKGDQ